MLGTRWLAKPPLGYQLDDEHPLAESLMGFYALNENTGSVINDATGNLVLSTLGAPTWSAPGGGAGGALNLVGTNVGIHSGALPLELRTGFPISWAMGCRILKPASAGASQVNLIGVTMTTGPYQCWEINYSTANKLGSQWNIGGSFTSYTSGYSPPTGVDIVLSGELSANGALYYTNGNLALHHVATIAGVPYYQGTVQFYVGSYGTDGSPPNMAVYWVAWWNRILQPAEHAALAQNPWQVFEPKRSTTAAALLASIPKSYTLSGPSNGFVGAASSPFTLASNLELNIPSDSVTLSGAGVTFSPSSTISFANAASHTFTGNPSAAGAHTISASSGDSYTISPSSLTYTAYPSFTLTGPSSGTAGQAEATPFAFTPTASTTDTVTLSDNGAGGVFKNSGGTAITSLTWASSNATLNAYYTPATAGTFSLSFTSANGGQLPLSPWTLTVTAIGFTLTVPATGPPLSASGAITVHPASSTTDTLTLSDNGAGGSFSPSATLSFTSAADQTVYYTPASVGVKTITATTAKLATVTNSPAKYAQVPATTGSIRFFGQCPFATNSNSLLGNQTAATVAFRFQFNSLGATGVTAESLISQGGNPILYCDTNTADLGYVNVQLQGSTGSIGTKVPVQSGFTPIIDVGGNNFGGYDGFRLPSKIPNHVVISWTNSAQAIYLNGVAVASGTATYATLAGYAGVTQIGPNLSGVPVDIQIGDVAVWDGYPASSGDAISLYNGTYNPLTLPGSQATSWWPMYGVTPGAAPASGDIGLLDWGSAGNNFTSGSAGGLTSVAEYAAGLGYSPPVVAEAYVTKSGKLAKFFAVSTVPTPNGFHIPFPPSAINANPTFTWNGHSIASYGPVWSSTAPANTWFQSAYPGVAYRLLCGSVQSIGITSGGSGYSGSTVVAASGGGGTGLTFGTPVLATGITGYTLTGVQSYGQYTSGPSVTLSGITSTKAPYPLSYLNGTTLTINPIYGGLIGCGSGVSGTPSVTLSGGVGAGAAFTATLSGSTIGSCTKVAGGSGYSATTTRAFIVDTQGGTGSGATLTPNITGGAITSLTVTAVGTGYTNPIVVIQPGTGHSATATATQSSGVIQSPLTVTASGTGYGLGTTAHISDPTGTGCTLSVTMSGTGIASVTASGGTGYTNPTVYFVDGAQSGVTATVSTYIQSVPVTNHGSGYTSTPTITATDTGGGSGASLTPVMSGAASGDVVTYTVPFGWLQTVYGADAGATNSTLTNFAGISGMEGAVGLLSGFTTDRTMQAGYNMPAISSNWGSSASPMMNYAKKIYAKNNIGWKTYPGTVNVVQSPDGIPLYWNGTTNTSIYSEFYSTQGANPIDTRNYPGITGRWTVIYDDPQIGVGGGFPTTVTLTAQGDTTSTPVGSPAVVGNTVTAQFDVAYNATPVDQVTNLDIALSININNANQTYYIEDLWIIPPNNGAVPTRPSNPMAVDANMLEWLKTPSGNSVGALRYVDSVLGPGGNTNYVDASDLASADDYEWDSAGLPSATPPNSTVPITVNGVTTNYFFKSGTAQLAYVRAYNTNPSDPTYTSYYSPNLYGNNWWATSGTQTLGSGGRTYSSGYLALPPTDNGNYGGISTGVCAIEFQTTPIGQWHGIKTGQQFQLGANSTMPVTIADSSGNTATLKINNGANLIAYVTDVDKFVVFYPVTGNDTFTSGSSFAGVPRIQSATPISLSSYAASAAVTQPLSSTLPYEFAASACSQAGAAFWCNIPTAATDACVTAIAQRVAAYLTPGLKVIVEFGNETWNGAFIANKWVNTCANLAAYVPAGTPIGPYYKTIGSSISQGATYHAIRASAVHALFRSAFSALGRPADVAGTFGVQWGQPTSYYGMVGTATQYAIPMDYVHSTAYLNPYTDPTLNAALMPAGQPNSTGTPGNWPADAVLDYAKHTFYYQPKTWIITAYQAAYCAAYGQPVQPCSGQGGGSGVSLTSGYYYFFYTFTNGSGETTVGTSQSSLYHSGGTTQIVAPPCPNLSATGMTGINFYATPVNCLPGTEVWVGSMTAGSTPALSYTGNNVFSIPSQPTAGGTSPPAVNGIPPAYPPPKQAAYEAAVQTLPAAGHANDPILLQDFFYSPYFADVVTAYLCVNQVGYPAAPNSGLSVCNYYSVSANGTTQQVNPQLWKLAVSTSQAPGPGLSNKFSTSLGGFTPADMIAHDADNQVPGVQSHLDWFDAAAATVALMQRLPATMRARPAATRRALATRQARPRPATNRGWGVGSSFFLREIFRRRQ